MRSRFRSLELMDSTLDDLCSERISVILPPSNSTAFSLRLSIENSHDAVDFINNTINNPLYHQMNFDHIRSSNTLISFLQSYLLLLTYREYYMNTTILQSLDGTGPDMKSWKNFIHLLTRGFHHLPSH